MLASVSSRSTSSPDGGVNAADGGANAVDVIDVRIGRRSTSSPDDNHDWRRLVSGAARAREGERREARDGGARLDHLSSCLYLPKLLRQRL